MNSLTEKLYLRAIWEKGKEDGLWGRPNAKPYSITYSEGYRIGRNIMLNDKRAYHQTGLFPSPIVEAESNPNNVL